jgi:hypothetical protein
MFGFNIIIMIVVCINSKLAGFTYGRIYRVAVKDDIYGSGLHWVISDSGLGRGVFLRNSFMTIDEWKAAIKKESYNDLI